MKIILLGAPGAGKGTQAAMIEKRYGVTHISTGDLLRENIRTATPLGIKAKEYMDKGQLVPDDLVIELVKGTIKGKSTYLFDGFPRTIEQAKALDKITDIDLVININVDENVLLYRLTGRRVCRNCMGTFHIAVIGNTTFCPVCEDEYIYIRDDDKEDVIKARMEVYKKQSKPLIEYYEKQGRLTNIRCMDTPDKTFAIIETILQDKKMS